MERINDIIIKNFTKDIINHDMELIITDGNINFTKQELEEILKKAISNLTYTTVEIAKLSNSPSDNFFTEERLIIEVVRLLD